MPTRPLLPATFLMSQSIVSQASVAFVDRLRGPAGLAAGRIMTNEPSDAWRPRMSWKAKT